MDIVLPYCEQSGEVTARSTSQDYLELAFLYNKRQTLLASVRVQHIGKNGDVL